MRDDRDGVPDGFPVNGHPTNGHHPNGAAYPPALTRVLPLRREPVDDADAPVDLVAVQADDELVTALGARPAVPAREVAAPPSGGPDTGGRARDDRLVAMLAAWRAEIDADPIPELLDLDAAVAAVVAGIEAQQPAVRRRPAGRVRHLASLAAAAAIVVATVSGVGLGSQDAMPGDTLWAIQKVVNPERAESVEAKVAVEGRLQRVRSALAQGDTATAARELDAIRTQIPAVRGQEGQPLLLQEQEFLAAKLADTPPGSPADLSTPPLSNPAALPTGAPSAPSAPDLPSSGPAITAPPASQSATDPRSTDPGAGSRPPGGGSDAAVPVEPGGTDPAPPRPDSPRPRPQVTQAPEVTDPDPGPTGPGNSSGGGADPSADPGPAGPPPASGKDKDKGKGKEDKDKGTGGGSATAPDTTSDTTTAAGSVGASGPPTATTT
jgi:hypothetical protein